MHHPSTPRCRVNCGGKTWEADTPATSRYQWTQRYQVMPVMWEEALRRMVGQLHPQRCHMGWGFTRLGTGRPFSQGSQAKPVAQEEALRDWRGSCTHRRVAQDEISLALAGEVTVVRGVTRSVTRCPGWGSGVWMSPTQEGCHGDKLICGDQWLTGRWDTEGKGAKQSADQERGKNHWASRVAKGAQHPGQHGQHSGEAL